MKVTRRGQTTLPIEHRKRLDIKDGDDLLIEAKQGVLVRRVPDLTELAGVDTKYGTLEEARKIVERMREEY